MIDDASDEKSEMINQNHADVPAYIWITIVCLLYLLYHYFVSTYVYCTLILYYYLVEFCCVYDLFQF